MESGENTMPANAHQHRPLSRVVHGPRVSLGPLASDPPQRLPPILTISPSSPAVLCKGLADLQDSCYSSCSDSDHSSLSRNTSAASETLGQELLPPGLPAELAGVSLSESPEYQKLLDFALKLGFGEGQLHLVLERVGQFPPARDRVLAELTKLGPQDNAQGSADCGLSFAQLRSIVIDGSNLAMTHGHKEIFSCKGIKECVEFFRSLGHTDIKVFVPQFRRESARCDAPITDQHILLELEAEGILVWTPSRRVGGRRIVCHDDRYILKTAAEKDAVIVSNDEYRDLVKENPDQFRRLVQERLLQYSFVDGKFMPPDDPLGRHGPKLDQFLRKGGVSASAPLCPYGRKCTYGNKCKFYHPERPGGMHVSVTDRLRFNSHQLSPNSFGGKTLACRTQSLNPALVSCFRHQSPSPQRNRGVTFSEDVIAEDKEGHAALERQMSNPEGRSGAPPDPHPSWPWQLLGHETLVRNSSAPGVGPPVGVRERKESVSDSQLNLISGEEWEQSNLFIPSSAIWGAAPFSVSPVASASPFRPGFLRHQHRLKLFYHLSNLFPEHVVSAVMNAHPHETDPQTLCSLILALQKAVAVSPGFSNSSFSSQ